MIKTSTAVWLASGQNIWRCWFGVLESWQCGILGLWEGRYAKIFEIINTFDWIAVISLKFVLFYWIIHHNRVTYYACQISGSTWLEGTMDLSTFKLLSATLEVRYEKAFRLWDYSGRLWAKVANMWPNLKIGTAQPNVSTFSLDERYQLSVALDKSHIGDTAPISSLKDFTEKTKDFVKVISQSLEIEYFTRVGFRTVFVKVFPDKQQAVDAMISTKLITIPDGVHFGIQGKVLLPKYGLRWEGESVGVTISIEVRDRKIDFDPPAAVEELTSIHHELHELVYDIDYFTLGIVSTGQLDVMEWLSQAYHLVKRDSKNFLGVI